MVRGVKQLVIVVLVASIMGASSAADEMPVDSNYATYFVDDVSCDLDVGSGAFGVDWSDSVWRVVAPETIDTSKEWERKYGTGLHLKPLDTFRSGFVSIGGLVRDKQREENNANRADGARLRVILVNHTTVSQDFAGPWRFVRVVARLCERRDGVWKSIRYETVRGVKGSQEFWKAQPKTIREKDFALAFDRAVRSVLDWATKTAGTPWIGGQLVVDPKRVLWDPRRNVEDDLNAK